MAVRFTRRRSIAATATRHAAALPSCRVVRRPRRCAVSRLEALADSMGIIGVFDARDRSGLGESWSGQSLIQLVKDACDVFCQTIIAKYPWTNLTDPGSRPLEPFVIAW